MTYLIAEALTVGAVALVPLYTRIRAGAALAHETRAKLHSYLEEHPGSSRRELCAALNLHPMTLIHHLHVMGSLGLVVSKREGREILYHLERVPPRSHPVLRAGPRRALVELLLESPRSQRELSDATGLSQRLVAYHLARMAGLLAAEGRPRRYVVVDPEGIRGSLTGAADQETSPPASVQAATVHS